MDEQEFLKEYDLSKYDRPSVTADIAAFMIRSEESDNYRLNADSKLSILLIKRGGHPYKDCWALPGGFMQRGETLKECALREVYEETGVTPSSLMSVGVFSKPDRDPRGWIISEAFACVFGETSVGEHSGDDAADAKWFDVMLSENEESKYALDLTDGDTTLRCELALEGSRFGRAEFSQTESALAFDHAEIIASALTALKSCAYKSDMIFDFMPESFTLSALQRVYQAITGKTEQAANFRRKISPFVEETGEITQGAGHRPAKLYRKKDEHYEENTCRC